jgi:hypothetical protein
MNAKQKKIDAPDGTLWCVWTRPATGLGTDWSRLLVSQDKELCRRVAKDYAPRGTHVCVLPLGTEPAHWVSEDAEHWDGRKISRQAATRATCRLSTTTPWIIGRITD